MWINELLWVLKALPRVFLTLVRQEGCLRSYQCRHTRTVTVIAMNRRVTKLRVTLVCTRAAAHPPRFVLWAVVMARVLRLVYASVRQGGKATALAPSTRVTCPTAVVTACVLGPTCVLVTWDTV